MIREKLPQILLIRFKQNREIAPIHHMAANGSRLSDQPSKVAIQLRRPARDVHDSGTRFLNPSNDFVSDLRSHHFRSPRRSINMAMTAGLIAFASDVQLQRLQSLTA